MAKQRKYTRESLIASKRYAKYQHDFLAAILAKPEYTLREADRVVREFFEKPKGED